MTDANLVLGRIGTRRLLGGSIALDEDRAYQAVGDLGRRLGIADIHDAAEGIVQIAVARMANSIRKITIEQGRDPAEFTLVAFGGAGPMHATQVAEELGIREILIPIFPGNLSALGLLASDQRRERVRTFIRRLSDLDPNELSAVLTRHETEGRALLLADRFTPDRMRFAHSLDMRYSRQAFETEVDLAGHPRDVEALRAAFLETYGRRYGHADPEAEIEVVNVRTAAIGITPRPEIPRYHGAAGALEQAAAERRRMVVRGCGNACPVYDRERLPKDAQFEGPAVVEEAGATTVIFPGWRATVDAWGNLRLTSAG